MEQKTRAGEMASGLGKVSDPSMLALLKVNKALYKMPPIVEIANSRHYQVTYPQQSSYAAGETVVFDLQTGAGYVDPMTSYLRFLVTASPTTTGLGDWGSGSAANCLERVTVRSRDGSELSRLEGANLFCQYSQRYGCSRPAFDTTLVSQGYQSNVAGIASSNPADGGQQTLSESDDLGCVYSIPLHVLSPFFKQHKLLPSHICEGLRVEIQLASAGQALYTAAAAVAGLTYSWSGIELALDVYNLGDAYARKISEQAAREGLVLYHDEYYRQLASGSGTSYDFDIRKSASLAKQILCIPRVSAQLSTAIASSEQQCFVSAPYDWERIQFHIGSVYYPNKPLQIDGKTPKKTYEHYYYTLAAFRSTDCRDDPDVRPDLDFTSALATDAVQNKTAGVSLNCAAAWLGKSCASDLSGMMVNNSRSLIAELRFANNLVGRIDAYLKHWRVVKVFISNVVVRD
jgi:hypothetical protein